MNAKNDDKQMNEHKPGQSFFDMNNVDDKIGVYLGALLFSTLLIGWPLFFFGADPQVSALVGIAAGLMLGRVFVRSLKAEQGIHAGKTS